MIKQHAMRGWSKRANPPSLHAIFSSCEPFLDSNSNNLFAASLQRSWEDDKSMFKSTLLAELS